MTPGRPISSPFLHGTGSVTRLMAWVVISLLPVIAVSTWLFGLRVLIHLAVAVATAVFAEAVIMRLRQRPVVRALADGSAAVTALLLALCLPPIAPLWVTGVGVLFAIVVAKHLYGGLGHNLFNPAMAGYVVVLIAFPAQLSQWPVPHDPFAGGMSPIEVGVMGDAVTGATPLDSLRTLVVSGDPVASAMAASPLFGLFPSGISALLSLAWLAGGVLLLITGSVQWRIPLTLLAVFSLFALLSGWLEPARHAGLLYHLFSGGVIAAAFFIATDPVSAATTPRGQLVYAAGIGLLIYLIRGWGGYPDGVAFAVLLMNIAAPLIDHFTIPRGYGS